jgi:hypothetical protein
LHAPCGMAGFNPAKAAVPMQQWPLALSDLGSRVPRMRGLETLSDKSAAAGV